MDELFPTIEPKYRAVAEFIGQAIPFNRHIGLGVYHISRGHCVLRIGPAPFLTGDPGRPALHGGVLSTLIDTAGGAACFSMFDTEQDRASTLDLRVDYLRPGPTETTLFCEARVVRMGNRVCVTRMEVFAGRCPRPSEVERKPIATGQAVYNVVRRSR